MKTKLILLVSLGLLLMSFTAEAQELTGARPALKFVGSKADTFMVSVAPGESAGSLPSAYLFYAKDGSAFAVSRWFDGVVEAETVDIPAGSSIILPAPPGFLYQNHWHHVFKLNGAATDSVVVVPMDR